MASKRKRGKREAENQISAVGEPGEDEATGIARTVLRPTVLAAVTLKDYGRAYGDLELAGLVEALSTQAQAATEGDLARAEAMLTAQAHSLDAIFNNLARRAINTEYMDSLDRYLKLALRAQSQCRATWEALATIKNPPVMKYVKQANIAHGPQQVNNASRNGDSSNPRSRPRKNSNLRSELLEQTDGQRLDPGAPCAAGRADPAVAALGGVDGTEDC